MQYRKFGKLDWQVSALALGLENLPEAQDKAVEIIRAAIDGGVNFIDAGADLKRNAPLLARALSDGYREKVKIAAAVPAGIINAAADFERGLQELLQLFNNERPDFFVLAGLNRFTWEKAAGLKITKLIEKAVSEKKIGCAGFAFHDEYQFLRDIIAAYEGWTFCQFQFSFMDIDHHPGVTGLSYAAEKGLGVVVTKPLKGGRLTNNIPENVAKIWAEARPKRSAAEWGLRWVWNHGEVATAVCDMDSLEQVSENVALAGESEAGAFNVMDELAVSKARDAYRSLKPIPCTACRGCMPCPNDVDAPRIFEIYNDAVMYNDAAAAREIYRREKHQIENCNECKTCESRCGKRILLAEWLKKARQLLT